MTLFDVDDLLVVSKSETGNTKRAKKAARKTRPQPMPGLEAPKPEYEPLPAKHPDLAGIERVSHQISSMIDHGGNHRGEFRCDAVTHTFLLMVAQQFEFSLHGKDGGILAGAEDDDEYAATWQWLLDQTQILHPTLFPPQPLWPVPALRKWERLFAGVDMIGWRGELQHDVPSLVFCHASSMSGKQKAWGSFYTPFHLCKMMAMMLVAERPWAESFMEPCVGSGSMVVAQFEVVRQKLLDLQKSGAIHPSEVHRLMAQWVGNVDATDIDPEAVWCTAAQISVRSGFPCRARHPYRHPREED